ncbi:MAG: hypothetical protein WC489_07905 [Patescibacteria group bacterium]|jgi:hypothetical protein|nr:hypothetical protein [Methanoregulaceae archaeon]
MASPRKWVNPIYTPVRLEKAYRDIAELLGIGFTEAANAGLEVLIEDRLSNISDPRVTPEMVAEYRKVKDHHLKELELALHHRAILDAKARDLEAQKEAVAKARKDLIDSAIWVYDLDQERRKLVLPPGVEPIPGCQLERFIPELHEPVRSRKVSQEAQ